jgi:nitrite reductase (NO-forming)
MPNVSTHNSHGQYGMILVDPKEGFAEVDKEFYVMQGELYTMDNLGKKDWYHLTLMHSWMDSLIM